jgi:hypothetical protein
MPEQSVEELVLKELRALRKDGAGVRVETLARARTICQLLGAGDPYLAYTRLQHALLDSSLDRTIQAAAASLGFASEGSTHLDRLVDAGGDLHLEQRQVRRLSDQGLDAIARLVATNWAVESVPELTAIVASTPDGFELHLATSQPLVVDMSIPTMEILTGTERLSPTLEWTTRETSEREQSALREPIRVVRTIVETSVVIVWRGEIWPKFTTMWHGTHQDVAAEALGNKLVLRLVPGQPGAA